MTPAGTPDAEPSAATAAGGSSASGAGRLPVVGLAHGSRHPDGRGSVTRLMAEVARLAGVDAHPAYLDLAEPDLTATAARLAADGHRAAIVVPLLFTEAFHATVDVPAAVAEAAEASGVSLRTADILGTGPDVEDLLLDSAERAGVPADAALLVVAVGSSRPAANEAVHALAARLARRRGTPVRAAFGTAAPRVAEVADTMPARTGVVPMFLSPGLLLEPVARLAAERGWPMAPPLDKRAAPLVAARWRAVGHLGEGSAALG